jgi:4-amino-4-deoxy-L-arabinose transferase-like glycosyltransferase
MSQILPHHSGRMRPGHARAFWFWISVATLAALALRLFRLDAAGLWVDELWTVYVTADLSIMHNSKVVGYLPTWLGLWLSGVDPGSLPYPDSSSWQDRGVTHTAARLGSAMVGVLTVPLVALASRRMLGAGPAVMIAFLLATSPWHIYWSQASRFYSLQFLFYTLAIVLYFSATRERSRPLFAGAMGCMVLAFLSQPTALAILAIFGADWLIAHLRRRPLPIGAFEWGAGIAAVGLCAAVFLSDYFKAPQEWAQFVAFTGAEYQPPHKLGLGAVYMTGPALVAVALAAAWAMRTKHERLSVYLLLTALLPLGIFAIWSLGNFVGLRYLMITLFGWIALAAIALDRLAVAIYRRGGDTALSVAPLAVVIASAAHLMMGYYSNAHGFHPRWPEAYAYVAQHAQPGDVIASRHPIVGQYYLRRSDIVHLPRDAAELRALGTRVWLVSESESTVNSDLGAWVYPLTELRRSLELAIPRPISRVEVLLFDASRVEHEP